MSESMSTPDHAAFAQAIHRAIDWDFVEVFRGEDEPGYASPMDLCHQIATRVLPPTEGREAGR